MMKKAIIFTLVLALVIMLLSGCQGNSFSLDEGLYVLEQTEKNGGAAPAEPYLIVHGGSLYVVLDMGVSYQPSGAVTVNGNKVVMETVFANEPCKWTFKLIDNNRLKFVSAKSDIPPYGEAWKNGMEIYITGTEFPIWHGVCPRGRRNGRVSGCSRRFFLCPYMELLW